MKPRASVFFKAADRAEKSPGVGACGYLAHFNVREQEMERFELYFCDAYSTRLHWLSQSSFGCEEWHPCNERGNRVRQLALQFMAEMIKSGCAPENPEAEG